jgi:hypothetical protein
MTVRISPIIICSMNTRVVAHCPIVAIGMAVAHTIILTKMTLLRAMSIVTVPAEAHHTATIILVQVVQPIALDGL